MLDIGWSEILLIAVVAIVVIGPRELPAALRTLGGMMTKLRRMAGEFQGQFQQAMKEANLGDVTKEISEIRQTVSSMKGGMGLSPAAYLKNELGGTLTGTVAPAAAVTTAAAADATAVASAETLPVPPPPMIPTVASIEAMSGASPAAPITPPPVETPAEEAESPAHIPSAFGPMDVFKKS